ncbi:MAG TPA: hypothetical protein VF796_14065 [Humisphaera sp.]
MVAVFEEQAPTSGHAHASEETAVRALCRWFPPRRAAYVTRVLTPDERAVIADPADALILARIKRMPSARLRRFDRLVPSDPEHHQLFRVLQMNWLRDEEYLLTTRLGRRPTPKELFVDFMHHKNGLRFRAYFALKYPRRMRPVCE